MPCDTLQRTATHTLYTHILQDDAIADNLIVARKDTTLNLEYDCTHFNRHVAASSNKKHQPSPRSARSRRRSRRQAPICLRSHEQIHLENHRKLGDTNASDSLPFSRCRRSQAQVCDDDSEDEMVVCAEEVLVCDEQDDVSKRDNVTLATVATFDRCLTSL